jgi:hypothetical protein
MTVDLTPEQSHALRAGDTVQFADPATSAVYVLVPQDSYHRLQSLLADGPLSEEERRTVLEGVWKRADWDDPEWDEYEKLPQPGLAGTKARSHG